MLPSKIKLYAKQPAYIWQTELHNYISTLESNEKVIIIKAARQVFGKSIAAMNELIRFSLKKPNIKNAYIAPTYKLSEKMYDDIVKSCRKFIKKANKQDLSIVFLNDSKVSFFSAEQRDNLRGFTVTGVMIIDEASFIQDDVYYELLSSWVVVHKALTIIISTPKHKSGFFYELYLKGLTTNKYYKTFDWATDYPVDENTDRMIENKLTIPYTKYISEYVGLFLDGIGSVFRNIESCIEDNDISKATELYGGLDFGTGSGKDYTELIFINQDGKQVFNWSTNNLEPTKQIEELSKIFKSHSSTIKCVQLEINSIGKVYFDMLKKQNPKIKFKQFTTSNSSKRKIVESLQVAFENSIIRILSDKDLRLQLSAYEETINQQTLNHSYNAPKGFNDDKVIALMLAWDNYKNRNNTIKYSFT